MMRDLPLPASISAEARAALATLYAQPGRGDYPALDDAAGWAASAAAVDAMLLATMRPDGAGDLPAIDLGGVTAHVIDVTASVFGTRRGFYIHGGGLTIGAGQSGAWMAKKHADGIGLPMLSIDYRMPPASPYPAALDDCVAAYRALVETTAARDVVVMGVSAGGNLAAALVLRARDEGLPPPGGVVLITPEIDLTESGDSFETNMGG